MTVKALFVFVFSAVRSALRQTKAKTKMDVRTVCGAKTVS
jgi:hypothetical protein